MRLTEAQRRRLTEIRDYMPTAKFRYPGFGSRSATDKSLLKKGFVETITYETRLGGAASAVRGMLATFILCRITDLGRAALAQSEEKK